MESKKSMALEGGQGTGSKLADLHLDDLLGLTDPIPEESPVQTPKPATPGAFDPFNSQPQVGPQFALQLAGRVHVGARGHSVQLGTWLPDSLV